MAVKARNRKRQESKDLLKRSMKIKCCYCDAKNECPWRKRKEESENKGVATYCTQTPNINRRKKKKDGPSNMMEALFLSEDKKTGFGKRKKAPAKHYANKNKR